MGHHTHIEIIAIHITQLHCYRVFSRIGIINVTSPVGGEICIAVLIIWDLELPNNSRMSARTTKHSPRFVVIGIPAIQPDDILDKNKVLGASHCQVSRAGEIRRYLRSRIYLVGK